ncbi:MAG: ComEA family DNA-binding protein [Myxococcota bacterium]
MPRAATRATTLIATALLLRAACDRDSVAHAPRREAPAAGGARLLYGAPLDANREPAEALALLPRIGPARATAIVAERPLCSLADVDRVPGIGPITVQGLAQSLAFLDLPQHCADELQAIGD